MSEELKDQETPDVEPDLDEEELELSHTDKLVGVFTEPTNTFSKMANEKAKVTDWLIPIIILIIVVSASQYLLLSNPNIKYAAVDKTMAMVEKQFDAAVDAGQMTREAADQQLDATRERVEQQMEGFGVMKAVGNIVVLFVVLFLISGVYFACIKFILKGDGTYANALSGYGLTFYIGIVQWILIAIIGLALEKGLQDLSLASLLDSDKSTWLGWFFAKIDVFAIWSFTVLSIAYAKLFKSPNTGKYFALIFGLWIGVSLLFFLLVKAFPFLAFFTGG